MRKLLGPQRRGAVRRANLRREAAHRNAVRRAVVTRRNAIRCVLEYLFSRIDIYLFLLISKVLDF